MEINTLNPELQVFFSREVKGEVGEDLVEKQTAEQGLINMQGELPLGCYAKMSFLL